MFDSKRLLMGALAATGLAFAASSANAATLLHNWTFDTNGSDSAGSADTTLGTGVAITTGGAGQFGEALSVPNTNFGALTTAGAVTLPATDFSYTAWVNVDATGSDGNLYVMGNQDGGGVAGTFMRIDNEGTDGDLFGRVNKTITANGTVIEGGTVDSGQWVHVALTVSSTAGLTIYVNGTSVGNAAAGTSHTVSTDQFGIGVRPDRTGIQAYFGLIDDVAVFDGVLTQTELNTVIASGAAAVPEPSSLALLGLGGLLIARRRRSA